MEAVKTVFVSFKKDAMGGTRFASILSSLLFAAPAAANGFVKKSNELYGKLSFSVDKKTRETVDEGTYDKSTQQFQGYGEIGLPLPWRSQLSVATSVRQVIRTSSDLNDSFESRGFSDTQMNLKSSVYEGEVGRLLGVPLGLLFAAEHGFNLPTTPKKYRNGSEAILAQGVAAERKFLVSPIDRGAFQLRQGLGLSMVSSGVWLSASHNVNTDDDLSAQSQTSRLELGTSLPLASWLQFSLQRVSSRDLGQLGVALSAKQVENSFGLSGGFTFIPGWAAEIGTNFINTVHFYQWSAGISYRTM